MINVTDKKMCCGCTACFNVCPKKCISMEFDNEGFLYPAVDKSKCIQCNMCDEVCPCLNIQKEIVNEKQEAYIVAHKNYEILKDSTSGGMFTAIADYVIENDGIVIGATMEDNFIVKHIEVEKKDQLYKFRNSKYVQSELGNLFSQIRKYLLSGRKVCFSGTPCQVEALKSFLKRDYENLILVDVVCRAVPSPGVWNKYVKYITKKNNSKPESIRFRDKSLGYQFSTMQMTFANGKIVRNGIESDIWLRMFFSGMIIRPSCTECKFRKRYHISDFTIWDCFNVAEYTKDIDEKLGATNVLIHSKKGRKIFEDIKENLIFLSIDPKTIVNGMKELSESPKENEKKDMFFKDYSSMDIEEVINKYFPMTILVRVKKIVRIVLNRTGIDVWVKRIKRKLA